MARFNASQADNYGGNGGGGFFSLRDDGEQAQVRFMYNDMDDVEAFSVHRVEFKRPGDRKKISMYVNCLREYNEPVDNCPFCKNGMPTSVKLFVPIFDTESGQVKTWDRGKKFISKLQSLIKRYGEGGLVSHIFTIERNGAPGDTSTTYEIWEDDADEITLEDLPELPNIPVKDKTAEDMEYFLEEGNFPPEDDEVDEDSDDEDEAPRRRSGAGKNKRTSHGRRTPAGRSKETF